jgi:hypothetical protein
MCVGYEKMFDVRRAYYNLDKKHERKTMSTLAGTNT